MAAAWHQGVLFSFRVGKGQKVKPVGSILGQIMTAKKKNHKRSCNECTGM